jgi:hypothetical protein
VDLESFTRALEALLDRVPEALLRDLNGGVSVSEEAHRRADDPPGVYILGEYITDPHLGSLIMLYHGSFARLFGGEPPEVWEREAWSTLRHELRHHVEGAAGLRDLDIEDLMELQRMRAHRPAVGPLRVRGRLPRLRRRE